jgi:AcrR family transcriptional regulator
MSGTVATGMSPTTQQPGRRYGGLTPEERRAERRRRFVEAARGLFADRGYAATTIEALCAASGLAARYLYEEFGDREGVLRAVYDEAVTTLAEAYEEAVAAVPGDDAAAVVEAGIAAVVRTLAADERRARIIYVVGPPATRAMEEHALATTRAFRDRLVAVADRLVAAGELPARDHGLTMLAVAGATNQLVEDWLADPPRRRADPSVLVAELTAIALAALSSPR